MLLRTRLSQANHMQMITSVKVSSVSYSNFSDNTTSIGWLFNVSTLTMIEEFPLKSF